MDPSASPSPDQEAVRADSCSPREAEEGAAPISVSEAAEGAQAASEPEVWAPSEEEQALLDQADALKEEGNVAYKAGEYHAAIDKYWKVGPGGVGRARPRMGRHASERAPTMPAPCRRSTWRHARPLSAPSTTATWQPRRYSSRSTRRRCLSAMRRSTPTPPA
jgi:hypothetical protein